MARRRAARPDESCDAPYHDLDRAGRPRGGPRALHRAARRSRSGSSRRAAASSSGRERRWAGVCRLRLPSAPAQLAGVGRRRSGSWSPASSQWCGTSEALRHRPTCPIGCASWGCATRILRWTPCAPRWPSTGNHRPSRASRIMASRAWRSTSRGMEIMLAAATLGGERRGRRAGQGRGEPTHGVHMAAASSGSPRSRGGRFACSHADRTSAGLFLAGGSTPDGGPAAAAAIGRWSAPAGTRPCRSARPASPSRPSTVHLGSASCGKLGSGARSRRSIPCSRLSVGPIQPRRTDSAQLAS